MDDVVAYFRDKIKRDANFYKARALEIDGQYLAQVEKLAKRTRDEAPKDDRHDDTTEKKLKRAERDHAATLAEFFCYTMSRGRIVSVVDNILSLLRTGRVVEADEALEDLKKDIDFVETRLKHPFFRTGFKQRKTLDETRNKANAKRKKEADQNHQRWITEATETWKRSPRLTATACGKLLIAKFKLDQKSKTVEDVIREFRPPKVGGAG
jgi:hypothetical protein